MNTSNKQFNRTRPRGEDLEGDKQKRKYEETLKQKKELLKQEFDHLEEIRKFDELSVSSLNEVKFKNEFDKLVNIKKQKQQQLFQATKRLGELSKQTADPEQGQTSTMLMASTSGFRSMVNNHHSDPLYQTFSKNLLVRSPNEYQEYVSELRSELDRYQQLIETEKDKTYDLELNLDEVQKSNIKLHQEIHELKLVAKIAQKRFGNMESVEFLANENQTMSQKNLKVIKAELKEMQEMRKAYRKKQQEVQKEYKKEIYVGEEYVSHNGMKIEEAEQKNNELEREIQMLEQEQKSILEKRQKSQNILSYINAFEMFEQIFMNRIPEEELGNAQRIVDQYYVAEELLYEQGDLINEELKTHTDEGEAVKEDFDRDMFRNVIFNFFETHPQGVDVVANFMVEKYWQLMTELQQNNQSYEVLLQEKTHFKNEMDSLERELSDTLSKNTYMQREEPSVPIREPRKQLLEEMAQIEGIVDDKDTVAYDTGLFVSHITRGHTSEAATFTTTLNIVSLELDDVTENKNLLAKNLKAQNLLFNFFLSFSQLLYRAAQTLQIVSDNSHNMTSIDLNSHIAQIIQFVEQIWSKSAPQKRKDSKPHKKSMVPQPRTGHAASPDLDVQDRPASDPISFHQISTIFEEVFLRNPTEQQHLGQLVKEASRYFYVQCKQDQLIWLLLSPTHLRGFLVDLKRANSEYLRPQNISKLKLNILLPSYQIGHLRQELVHTFSQNFHQLLTFYQVLDLKLKDLSSDLKIYLKEKDPKFDPVKLTFMTIKEDKESATIKEARSAIARKMELYRKGELQTVSEAQEHQTTKIFHTSKMANGSSADLAADDLNGLAKMVPEVQAQQEYFMKILREKEKLSEPDLQNLKDFFHSKLHHKYEPSVQAKKLQEENKNKQNQRSTISEKDEFDEERDQIKDSIYNKWQHEQELNSNKALIPQELEQVSEKKAQIKDVTDRLYGDRGETAHTLKTMSVTTNILSDIDKLEKQPSAIEQPFLISNFKLQKKTMHRNLNKELSLPTLHFLKPTSAYFARRQQSQEQLRAMAQKKYDLIESGMAPTQATMARPATDMQRRKMKTQERNVVAITQQMNASVEKFYQRYGSQEQSQQFLGYLMKGADGKGQMTLQDFPFQFNPKRNIQSHQELHRSAGGARPKSILVFPQQ